jgi:hypothetical protein
LPYSLILQHNIVNKGEKFIFWSNFFEKNLRLCQISDISTKQATQQPIDFLSKQRGEDLLIKLSEERLEIENRIFDLNNMTIAKGYVQDETDSIQIVWFNQKYINSYFKEIL